MKKWIRLGLCTAVLAVALACTALAAEGAVYGTGAVSYDGAKCSVTYSEGLTNGNQYVLLLVTDPNSINDEGVMYIDQAAAAGGKVSFVGFIPKEWPTDGQTWTALLGGEFTDGASPKTIGTLTFGEGVPVSGAISYYNSVPRAVNVEVQNEAGEIVRTFTTNADGTFSVTLPIGSYSFVVKAEGYLMHTYEINVSGVVEDMSIDYQSYAGDVDASGAINGTDVGYVLSDYNKTEPYYNTDFNNSGAVNGTDLSIVLGNIGKVSD